MLAPAAAKRQAKTLERPTHFPLETLASGFNKALERLEGATRTPDNEASFHALFEALAWAGAIYDRIKGRHDVPRELRGLWFVRNLVLHRGADVVLLTVVVPGAAPGQLVLGKTALATATQWGWQWPPRQLLPEPDSLRGSSEYDSHVAGRMAADTLKVISTYLEDVRD
jgi:hypothetical protein